MKILAVLLVVLVTGWTSLAAAGEVDARLDGDTWIVIVNDEERYEVPLAAIEGG